MVRHGNVHRPLSHKQTYLIDPISGIGALQQGDRLHQVAYKYEIAARGNGEHKNVAAMLGAQPECRGGTCRWRQPIVELQLVVHAAEYRGVAELFERVRGALDAMLADQFKGTVGNIEC